MGALPTLRPVREMERWARSLERRFSRFLEEWPFEEEELMPPVESFVRDGMLVIRADVPGLEPKDVEVDVLGNVLTIKGERKSKGEAKTEDYIRREIIYGSFERQILLPEGTNSDQVKAEFKNGMIEVTMPLAKELEAKKIPIEVEAKKPNG